MQIKYTDEFLEDLELRVAYFQEVEIYEGLLPNKLQNKLNSSLQKLEELLLAFPEIKAPNKQGVRIISLDDFKGKLVVHYRLSKSFIEFLGLFHTSQKPIN